MKKKKIIQKATTNAFILLLLGGVIWTIATYVKYYNVENVRLWMALGLFSAFIWVGLFIGLFIDYKLIERLKK